MSSLTWDLYGAQGELRVVVDCPRGATVKLKYEPTLGTFTVARALPLGPAWTQIAITGITIAAADIIVGATHPVSWHQGSSLAPQGRFLTVRPRLHEPPAIRGAG